VNPDLDYRLPTRPRSFKLGTAFAAKFAIVVESMGYTAVADTNLCTIFADPTDANIQKFQKIRDAVERVLQSC
jgi:hypothetical protein